MLCKRCDNSDALLHHAEISNDSQSELYFCMKCKKTIQSNSLQMVNPFSSFSDDKPDRDRAITCTNCGLTTAELIYDGRPGCPSCYKYFDTVFGPISENGNMKKYTGKKPSNYIEITGDHDAILKINKTYIKLFDTKGKLEEELKKAVIEERYEDAAILRDRIKEVIESE